MADGLYRLLYGTRPFDWLMFGIDATVLIVSTAGFVLSLVMWRKAKVRKRQRTIREFMARGQQFRSDLPMGSADIPHWNNAVDQLIQDAAHFFQQHSPTALAVFLDTSNMPTTINPGVWITAHGHFVRLTHCLRNLRSIMENAEAYF